MIKRPILRWHGGKWRIAPWIIEQMPPHETYTEVFGGGASVLLRKERSRLEVYNDLDGSVVNLFRVIRERPFDLASALAMTPFSRDEFAEAAEPDPDPIEAARRLLVRSHMGFGSNGALKSTGFRAAGLRSSTLPVHQWAGLPWIVQTVSQRLRAVVIENRDALDVLLAQDGPSALHYVDPPYMMSVRSDRNRDYNHEMTDGDHADLLTVLKTLRGRVILSGYPSATYDQQLKGWRKLEREAFADGAAKRTEVLWINFDTDEFRLVQQ